MLNSTNYPFPFFLFLAVQRKPTVSTKIESPTPPTFEKTESKAELAKSIGKIRQNKMKTI